MIDERARDLINEELDHELTADEQHELAAILDASAAAREYRDGLQAMHEVLSGLPREEPPEDLHERISATVDTIVPVAAPQGAPHARPAIIRYGLAASLGLMVAVAIYETQPDAGLEADVQQMVGTMAPDGAAIDRFRFDEAGVSARASLAASGDETVLEVALESDGSVDVDLDFSKSGYRLAGLSHSLGELQAFSYSDHVLRARSRGRQQFAVVLERDAAAVGGGQDFVGLAFSRDGTMLKRGRLQTN